MKNLHLKIFSFLFLCSFSTIYGQYTEIINSNKPGLSESPYSVGSGVYQFESNLFFRNTSIEPTFSVPQSLGFDLLFRTSFFSEKLEFNAQINYRKDQVAFKNIFTSSYNTTGFGVSTIGAKYLLYQQEYQDKSKEVRSWKRRIAFDKKRWIPSIAVYLGINTDLVNEIYKTDKVTAKIGLLFQQNLSDDFNLVSNFYFDKMNTDLFEYSYIITSTFNFNPYWSAFLENQTEFKQLQNDSNIGVGLAFLLNKDLQINASARYLIEGVSEGYNASIGLSYRIDTHKDSYKELDENGRLITKKDTPITRYNRKKNSFFSRLFSVFKKKKKNRKKQKRKRN